MSKVASATIAVTVTGDGLNLVDSDTVQNTSTAVAPTSANLAAGPNVIQLPTGATRVKLKPPPTNALSLTLKGVTGDTGFLLAAGEPSYLSFDPSVTSFVLAAGGAVSVLLEWV